ncbi:hypothetical protein C8J56DRAFT_880770 [Mycena floridula]|nr:hypothetical protein C8J56DRAFT_880770 [Mycena floridula]
MTSGCLLSCLPLILLCKAIASIGTEDMRTSSNYSPSFRGCFLFVPPAWSTISLPAEIPVPSLPAEIPAPMISRETKTHLDYQNFEGEALLFVQSPSCMRRDYVSLVCVQIGTPRRRDGSLDVARIGDDSVDYTATCEGLPWERRVAFHGNVVSVYIKNSQGVKGPECLEQDVWTCIQVDSSRIQVDNFGPLDAETHTGTIYSVYTAKIGGCEFEALASVHLMEFSYIAAAEHQGVTYVYAQHFRKTEIMDQSVGQLVVTIRRPASRYGKELRSPREV